VLKVVAASLHYEFGIHIDLSGGYIKDARVSIKHGSVSIDQE